MKIKSIIGIMLAVIVAIPLLQSVASYANTSDTKWSFALPATTSTAYSSYRAKDNTSSVYVKPSYMSSGLYSIWMTIAGSKYSTGVNANTSCQTKSYYVSTAGTAYKMYNYVKENGYSYAALGGNSRSGSGTATGVWSPDCAGESSISEMPH